MVHSEPCLMVCKYAKEKSSSALVWFTLQGFREVFTVSELFRASKEEIEKIAADNVPAVYQVNIHCYDKTLPRLPNGKFNGRLMLETALSKS